MAFNLGDQFIETIYLHYKSSIIYYKDNYFSNEINNKIKLNNVILDSQKSIEKDDDDNSSLASIVISYEKQMNVYEIEYTNIVGILSKVGGLLSTLKFIGTLLTSPFGEPSLKFEIINDVFQKLNKDEKCNTTSNTIDIIDINNEIKTENSKNLLSNYSINYKSNDNEKKDCNLKSLNDSANSVVTKKAKLKQRNFICSCCYKKDKDKIIALNSYFDKAIDIRNYFKRLTDIEKIKAILSNKNEKDKEFIFKKFNQDELEELNFNVYERELILKLYQKTIIQNSEHDIN